MDVDVAVAVEECVPSQCNVIGFGCRIQFHTATTTTRQVFLQLQLLFTITIIGTLFDVLECHFMIVGDEAAPVAATQRMR